MAVDVQQQKYQYILPVGLFTALFVFGCHHATKGMELTDEGLYLSSALRFSLGDLPFRDETMSILSQSGVILSPVFMVFPEISLFHMRLIGLTLHVATYVVFFLFLSRYAPPLLTALACTVMFLSNNFFGVLTPGYDLLSSDFILLSMTAWLSAIVSDKKHRRLLFAAIGGIFFSLSVMSYSTQILGLFIPLAVILFALLYPDSRGALLYPSVLFLATFLMIFVVSAVILAASGLWQDFFLGFTRMAGITGSARNGVMGKSLRLIKDYARIAPYGLALTGLLSSGIVFIRKGRFVHYTAVATPFAIIAVFLVASAFLRSFISIHHVFPLLVLSFTVALTLINLFFVFKGREGSNSGPHWNNILTISIAWGIASSVIYGFSSTKGLLASVGGATPLFVVGILDAYKRATLPVANDAGQPPRIKLLTAVTGICISTFLIGGAVHYYTDIYFNQKVDLQTEPFRHPKLRGVYSTPTRVRTLERLLWYLQDRVKPGDYFLTYNNLPMLYFLTHTRPAYGTVWARDDRPFFVRENLVKNMIDHDRIPQYCVRMLALPGNRWNQGMVYDEYSPLDAFVQSNYHLEKIIYPFEVWRRGNGPKFRLFEQTSPVLKSSFLVWKGPDTISCEDLSKTTSPLKLLEQSGEFTCSRVGNEDNSALKISPAQVQRDWQFIQFGYSLDERSLHKAFASGRELVMIVEGRVSHAMQNWRTMNAPQIFIEDKADSVEINSAALYSTAWEQYIIAKEIRNNAFQVRLGVHWGPENERDWLEIRNIRVLVR